MTEYDSIKSSDELSDFDQTKKQFEKAEEEMDREYAANTEIAQQENNQQPHHHGLFSTLLKPIR